MGAMKYGCPENFGESLTAPTATFHGIFDGHLFRSVLSMCVQKSKFVALPVPGIIDFRFDDTLSRWRP